MTLQKNFDNYICLPSTPIRNAMARINKTEQLYQLVVDHDGRLLGTLTDGDIRRALLRGESLDATVDGCMQAEFIAGRVGDNAHNRSLLISGQKRVNFLPLLDASGRIMEVLDHQIEDTKIDHALVMAGGYGQRMGEQTKSTPKPLLLVGGRPILDHVLSRLEMAGINNIYVSVCYLADQIKTFVAGRDNRAKIHFIEEDVPLGTAGALNHLRVEIDRPILVVNGDVLTEVGFGMLCDFHFQHGFHGTIGVTQHNVDVPFGVVHLNEDGLFKLIEEKPRITNFIAAGIYYLGPEFAALVPVGKPMDMPELLTLGKEAGLKIGLFPIHEYWADIGRPDDIVAADAEFAIP